MQIVFVYEQITRQDVQKQVLSCESTLNDAVPKELIKGLAVIRGSNFCD